MDTLQNTARELRHHPESGTLKILRDLHAKKVFEWVIHTVILILSLALIAYISYDTFEGIPFLDNYPYMTFQFWVCVVFLLDFFIELILSDNKWRYLLTHWFFFLISIPYLNLIVLLQWTPAEEVMYYLRFVPLVRGAYSLAMVAGYISANRATSLVASYATILVSIVYFASLIFYRQEGTVNSDVATYWDALWWACMNVTTIGCYINPMTAAGMICGVVLAGSGMLMLPLFTAMVVDLVKSYNEKMQKRRDEFNRQIVSEIRELRKSSPGFMKGVKLPRDTVSSPDPAIPASTIPPAD